MAGPSAYIIGWGQVHPDVVIRNRELTRRVDTTDEWLLDRTGIVERRVAPPHVGCADLGAAALRSALERSGRPAADVELLVGSAGFVDHDIPAIAALVARTVRSDAITFDVNSACSGFVFGLEVVRSLMATRGHSLAAVCAAEKGSLVADYDDRTSSVFWGDAAGAVVVADQPPPSAHLEIDDIVLLSDNEAALAVRVPRGGTFRMDNHRTRDHAIRSSHELARQLLGRAGLRAAELGGLVCHQANLRLIERLAAELGVPPERHWHNVEWAGNQSSAGAVTALAAGLDTHGSGLDDGAPILVLTVGAGLNAGGALLRWRTPK